MLTPNHTHSEQKAKDLLEKAEWKKSWRWGEMAFVKKMGLNFLLISLVPVNAYAKDISEAIATDLKKVDLNENFWWFWNEWIYYKNISEGKYQNGDWNNI